MAQPIVPQVLHFEGSHSLLPLESRRDATDSFLLHAFHERKGPFCLLKSEPGNKLSARLFSVTAQVGHKYVCQVFSNAIVFDRPAQAEEKLCYQIKFDVNRNESEEYYDNLIPEGELGAATSMIIFPSSKTESPDMSKGADQFIQDFLVAEDRDMTDKKNAVREKGLLEDDSIAEGFSIIEPSCQRFCDYADQYIKNTFQELLSIQLNEGVSASFLPEKVTCFTNMKTVYGNISEVLQIKFGGVEFPVRL